MENNFAQAIKAKDGRLVGILFAIRGRTTLLVLCRRGILYRTNIKLFTAIPGWIDSTFRIKSTVGGLDVYYCGFQREEIVPLQFKRMPFTDRNWRFIGALHYNKHRLIYCVLTGIHNEQFCPDTQEIGKSLESYIPTTF